MNKRKEKQEHLSDGSNNEIARQTLKIDWKLYETYLENSDLTENQKKEFIETLWAIMVQFVDLGFGIAPVQQVLEDKTRADSGSVESRSAKVDNEPACEGIE